MESSPQKASRQCWECLKRRLVCDYTLPHCRKCLKRGKDCPGYEPKKPLQWIETGKTTSRTRSKLGKYSTAMVLRTDIPVRTTIGRSSFSTPRHEPQPESWDTIRENYMKAYTEITSMDQIDRIYNLGDKEKIAEILSRGDVVAAAEMIKLEKDPLKALRRILNYIQRENLPKYNLRSEVSDAVQAVQYFNMRVIPEHQHPDLTLVMNPQLMILSPTALHLMTPTIHKTFVCLALTHHMLKLPSADKKQALVACSAKVLEARGDAIKELSRRIADKRTAYSDSTIASLITFLTNEIQSDRPQHWRAHADVLNNIIQVRGGIMKVYNSGYHMHPTVVLFYMLAVFGNCTSPANDQIVIAPTPEEDLENITEIFHELFPYCLCPPPVFYIVVEINHLRREASQRHANGRDILDLSLKATALLAKIGVFDVNDWAQPGPKFDEWLTLGSAFKHGALIYCIMSLQALALLPDTPENRTNLEMSGDALLKHLEAMIKSKRLQKYAVWPLSLLGAEAARRGEARRRWIERMSDELSEIIGSYCPLNNKHLLREYWDSGEFGWEQCFGKPYALMF